MGVANKTFVSRITSSTHEKQHSSDSLSPSLPLEPDRWAVFMQSMALFTWTFPYAPPWELLSPQSCVSRLWWSDKWTGNRTITHLIQSHSSAAINPASTVPETPRPYILMQNNKPCGTEKTSWAFRKREEVSHIGFKSHKKQPGEENRDSYGFLHTFTSEIFYSCEKKV